MSIAREGRETTLLDAQTQPTTVAADGRHVTELCEVAAEGEEEQARQTEHGLAVGAHLVFGVLERLVLIGAARLEHAAVIVRGGACTSDADHRGQDTHMPSHLLAARWNTDLGPTTVPGLCATGG